MLVFTYKLEKFIKKNILPLVLLVKDKYVIKGSFRRRIPYVTDIDIVNDTSPTVDRANIYDKLVDLIQNLCEYPNIILVYVTCGYDRRFEIKTGSEEELSKIIPLLLPDDVARCSHINVVYADKPEKRIFYLNEIIWPYYKLRWTPQEVLSNNLILPGSIAVRFTDVIKENSSLLLQYYLRIGQYFIGIDVVINYGKADLSDSYDSYATYQISYSNHLREYYYMLFPLKYYFRNNKDQRKKLEDLIEKKFGLYKQLMVRIDTYDVLYSSKNLKISYAEGIIQTIISDTSRLQDFHSNATNELKKISNSNLSDDDKMKQYNMILNVLYDEINSSVNAQAKGYFTEIFETIPENDRKKFYLPR